MKDYSKRWMPPWVKSKAEKASETLKKDGGSISLPGPYAYGWSKDELGIWRNAKLGNRMKDGLVTDDDPLSLSAEDINREPKELTLGSQNTLVGYASGLAVNQDYEKASPYTVWWGEWASQRGFYRKKEGYIAVRAGSPVFSIPCPLP